MVVFVESLNYDMEVSVSTDIVSKMLVAGIGALVVTAGHRFTVICSGVY